MGTTYDNFLGEVRDGDVLVELGVYEGGSLIDFAIKLGTTGKRVRLYGVDHGIGTQNEPGDWHSGNYVGTLWQNLVRAGHMQQVDVILAPSCRASLLFPDQSVALVYIDANHSYESMRSDLQLWLPKIRNGGIIGGHDINHQPIRQALDDVIGAGRWQEEAGTWSFRVLRTFSCEAAGSFERL